MQSFPQAMAEYRQQLQRGAIQVAYRGLMEYMMRLRTHLANQYPDDAVSGLYYGYMDLTCLALKPPALKERRLKIAIVFVHETFRFEVWLSGQNQQVQLQYWRLIGKSGWDKYHLAPQGRFADSILEHVLVAEPDWSDLDALTAQIESGTLAFIADVEAFLSQHP